MNKKALIHVKIDTGLGRFGVLPEHSVELVKIITSNFGNIYIEGVYTHFSLVKNKNITRKQFNIFISIIDQLKELGYSIPLKHACNSTAALSYPDMHMDMVRIGNLMYGLCPSNKLEIKNPAKIYSKIILLKNIPKGYYVGYGNRYKTRRPTMVAIVPFGYYDGLELFISQPNGIWEAFKSFIKHILAVFGIMSKTRKVKLNGKLCNILGKISMQNCIIDVTNLKNEVFVGDVVEINTRRINLSQSVARVYHGKGTVFLDSKTMPVETRTDSTSGACKRRETSIG